MGTSKIVYDETASDEFKCHLYDRNVGTNPFSVSETKNISIHIYCVDLNQKNSFRYGDSSDYAQNSLWSQCYHDTLPPKNKDLDMPVFTALKETNLRSVLLKPTLSNNGLRERLMSKNATNINGQIQNAVSSVSGALEVKKTRA